MKEIKRLPPVMRRGGPGIPSRRRLEEKPMQGYQYHPPKARMRERIRRAWRAFRERY